MSDNKQLPEDAQWLIVATRLAGHRQTKPTPQPIYEHRIIANHARLNECIQCTSSELNDFGDCHVADPPKVGLWVLWGKLVEKTDRWFFEQLSPWRRLTESEAIELAQGGLTEPFRTVG